MDRFSSLSNGRRERESTATSSRVGGCFSCRYPAACSGGRGGHNPSLQPLLVRELARTLATKPFEPPDEKLPDALTNLNYDQYRSIRFAPEKALWRDEKLPFEVQFFHRGFFYKNRVNIFQVVNRSVMPVPYRREDFSFGEGLGQWPDGNIGFAGFRIHAPINRPDYYDEVGVFLGASYFRAVAKGQTYGLSARGLAIDTGESKGEEFPFFKAFWLEKPAPNASSIVVHALLDSKGAAASYRFTIRPGQTTVFDVEMALYPRDVEHAGLAPMTSMFVFGPNDRKDFDDFRPAVHDSDGLAIFNGRGEQLWRPLNNPHDLQVSSFADLKPGGFGLMQRERNFAAYQDLESSFERRPSLWFEPIGRLGRRGREVVRDPDQGGGPRQHRRVLATEAAAGGQERAYLHLSPALGTGCTETRGARAIHANGGRQPGRGQQTVCPGADGRATQKRRSQNDKRGCDRRKIRDQQRRDATQSGNRRVASELSMLGQGTDSHRTARLPGAERGAGLRGVGLSMDALNQSPAPRRTDGRRFLPPESPLSMVPCRLDRTAMPGRAPTGSTRVSTFRRLFIFLGTILLMLAGGYGMHDVVKVGGVTVLEAVLLGLFLVLLAWVVFSFMSALAGFFVLLMRRTPGLPVDPAGPLPAVTARTAMLMPTYNEDPPALCRLEMSCSPKRPQSVPW